MMPVSRIRGHHVMSKGVVLGRECQGRRLVVHADELGVNEGHGFLVCDGLGIKIKDGHEGWDLILEHSSCCCGRHGFQLREMWLMWVSRSGSFVRSKVLSARDSIVGITKVSRVEFGSATRRRERRVAKDWSLEVCDPVGNEEPVGGQRSWIQSLETREVKRGR